MVDVYVRKDKQMSKVSKDSYDAKVEAIVKDYEDGKIKQTVAVDKLVELGRECKQIYHDLDIPYRQCYNVIHRAQYNKKPSLRQNK